MCCRFSRKGGLAGEAAFILFFNRKGYERYQYNHAGNDPALYHFGGGCLAGDLYKEK